jgi:hypothetical protein
MISIPYQGLGQAFGAIDKIPDELALDASGDAISRALGRLDF